MSEFLEIYGIPVMLFQIILIICFHRWFKQIVSFICDFPIYVAIQDIEVSTSGMKPVLSPTYA